MKRSRRTLAWAALLLAGLALAAGPSPAQEKDPWAPLRFLEGTWSGMGAGAAGKSKSWVTTFSLDLDGHVMIRKNRAEYPPKGGKKDGFVHEDMMVIYRKGGEDLFRAVYFDNEGNAVSYTASFPPKQPSVVFDSEGPGSGPRFRLTYEIRPDGSLAAEFQTAKPGGEFQPSVRALLKKVQV
jgi:hypothetical protein